MPTNIGNVNDNPKLLPQKTMKMPMAETDAPEAGAEEGMDMPASDAKQIVLDKSDPDIADAFEGCKVGDMYKVAKDDGNMLTLEAMPAEGEAPAAEEPDANPNPEERGGDSGAMYPANGAVDRLMKKKMGQ